MNLHYPLIHVGIESQTLGIEEQPLFGRSFAAFTGLVVVRAATVEMIASSETESTRLRAARRYTGNEPIVDELVTEGMMTLEAVRILKYVASPAQG